MLRVVDSNKRRYRNLPEGGQGNRKHGRTIIGRAGNTRQAVMRKNRGTGNSSREYRGTIAPSEKTTSTEEKGHQGVRQGN